MNEVKVVQINDKFNLVEFQPNDNRCTVGGPFDTKAQADEALALNGFNVPVEFKVRLSLRDVSSLLCSALEGGSNYWYQIVEYVEPPKVVFQTMPGRVFKHIDYPLNEGGALVIGSLEENKHDRPFARLDLAACARALELMAEKYPFHLADILKESADATTGDVFLQLALYGDIIYS